MKLGRGAASRCCRALHIRQTGVEARDAWATEAMSLEDSTRRQGAGIFEDSGARLVAALSLLLLHAAARPSIAPPACPRVMPRGLSGRFPAAGRAIVLRGGGHFVGDRDEAYGADCMRDTSSAASSWQDSSFSGGRPEREAIRHDEVQPMRAVYRDGDGGLGSGRAVDAAPSTDAEEAASVAPPAPPPAKKLIKGKGAAMSNEADGLAGRNQLKAKYSDAPDEATAFCMMMHDYGEDSSLPTAVPAGACQSQISR